MKGGGWQSRYAWRYNESFNLKGLEGVVGSPRCLAVTLIASKDVMGWVIVQEIGGTNRVQGVEGVVLQSLRSGGPIGYRIQTEQAMKKSSQEESTSVLFRKTGRRGVAVYDIRRYDFRAAAGAQCSLRRCWRNHGDRTGGLLHHF